MVCSAAVAVRLQNCPDAHLTLYKNTKLSAVFLVLLRGMLKGARAARPWLISLVVAAVTYLFVLGAWYVAAGALPGLASAYLWAEEK